MRVKELVGVLSGLDPEMEVVARFPHCCGRHNYMGRDDLVNVAGATDDAWWIPKVGVVRIAGMDPAPDGGLTEGRDAVGIEGLYPDDDGLPHLYAALTKEEEKAADQEWHRRMCLHRRHESDGSSDDEKGGTEDGSG